LLSLRKDTLAESHDFDFPLTRETLASLMGTTTESVIRTLSDFRSRGWIDYHDGKISLSNERELEKLVVES
jgi:CRP/FNR family transcriptional regulator